MDPLFLQPSSFSASGMLIDHVQISSVSSRQRYGFLDRVFIGLGLIFAAATDVAVWTAMTVTVYPTYQIGLYAHTANLVASFLQLFFGFPVYLFRSALAQTVSDRPFHPFGPAANPASQKWALGDMTRDFEVAFNSGVCSESFLEFYLRRGMDPNSRSADGRTLLIAAAQHQRVTECFETNAKVAAWLQRPIDPNLKDPLGFNALSYTLCAISYGRRELTPEPDDFITRGLFSIASRILGTDFRDLSYGVYITLSYPKNDSPTLFTNGAHLQELDFIAYRDFAVSFLESYSDSAATLYKLQELQTQASSSSNRYIQLLGKTLLTDHCRFLNNVNSRTFSHRFSLFKTDIEYLERHAQCLVREKDTILKQWNPTYRNLATQQIEETTGLIKDLAILTIGYLPHLTDADDETALPVT